jgi:hypothetical protein
MVNHFYIFNLSQRTIRHTENLDHREIPPQFLLIAK